MFTHSDVSWQYAGIASPPESLDTSGYNTMIMEQNSPLSASCYDECGISRTNSTFHQDWSVQPVQRYLDDTMKTAHFNAMPFPTHTPTSMFPSAILPMAVSPSPKMSAYSSVPGLNSDRSSDITASTQSVDLDQQHWPQSPQGYQHALSPAMSHYNEDQHMDAYKSCFPLAEAEAMLMFPGSSTFVSMAQVNPHQEVDHEQVGTSEMFALPSTHPSDFHLDPYMAVTAGGGYPGHDYGSTHMAAPFRQRSYASSVPSPTPHQSHVRRQSEPVTTGKSRKRSFHHVAEATPTSATFSSLPVSAVHNQASAAQHAPASVLEARHHADPSPLALPGNAHTNKRAKTVTTPQKTNSNSVTRNRIPTPAKAAPTPKSSKKTQCDTCNERFPDEAKLKAHMKKEHNRPFYCVFNFAGCSSTFANKNEWKRHVRTQHLILTYWLCTEGDCAQIKNNDKGNSSTKSAVTALPDGHIFNRKDLFTQHVKRMHMPSHIRAEAERNRNLPSNSKPIEFRKFITSYSPPEWNERVRQMQNDSEKLRCALPTRMACPKRGCDRNFNGYDAWDRRMEHVAKYFENKDVDDDEREEIVFGGDGDPSLMAWATDPSVNVLKPTGDGKWLLNDPLPVKAASSTTPRSSSRSSSASAQMKKSAANNGRAGESKWKVEDLSGVRRTGRKRKVRNYEELERDETDDEVEQIEQQEVVIEDDGHDEDAEGEVDF